VAPLSDCGVTGLVYWRATPIVGAHVYLFAANTTGYGGGTSGVEQQCFGVAAECAETGLRTGGRT